MNVFQFKYSLHIYFIVIRNFYFTKSFHMWPNWCLYAGYICAELKHILREVLYPCDTYCACNTSFTNCMRVPCPSAPRDLRCIHMLEYMRCSASSKLLQAAYSSLAVTFQVLCEQPTNWTSFLRSIPMSYPYHVFFSPEDWTVRPKYDVQSDTVKFPPLSDKESHKIPFQLKVLWALQSHDERSSAFLLALGFCPPSTCRVVEWNMDLQIG